MQQRLAVVRQLGMDDQRQVGDIEAARGDVGRDQHAGVAIAQRLQRVRALGLCQLAGEGHRRETAFEQPRVQPLHRLARRAEHQRRGCLMETQHVDHGILDVARRDANRRVLDVGVLLVPASGFNPHGVTLKALGKRLDITRHGGREHQRPAGCRRRVEDELQVLAKAEIQHLVGFIKDDGLELGKVEALPLKMVAQPAGGADHDVCAHEQQSRFRFRIHATDAGDDLRTGLSIEPDEFAVHLHRELPRRRHDQCQWGSRTLELLGGPEQRFSERQAERHGLAGAGLRRHEQIATDRALGQNRELNVGRCRVLACGQRARERGMRGRKGHGCVLGARAAAGPAEADLAAAECLIEARYT